MASSQPEIIDLTLDNSDEPQIINVDSDAEPGEIQEPKAADNKKSRRKKKKKKSIVANDGMEVDAQDDRGEGPSQHKQDERDDSDAQDLFFVDLTPAVLPSASQHIMNPAKDSQDEQPQKLLLPAHIQVFGSTPVEFVEPTQDEQGEDFIDYLDFDSSRKGIPRYYEDPEEKPANTRHVCKNCGAEGDHTSAKCPVLICLTCGARDEHVTRSCPINKVCFSCGMKGHLSSKCPNYRNRQSGTQNLICNRCGSDAHLDTECSTLWRIYEYVTEEERIKIIEYRLGKAALELGKGGEAYIATDNWCYNCGQSGHWGDDCTTPFPHGVPNDASAFHWTNVSSGPFAEGSTDKDIVARRDFRDWERDDHFLANVGKAGKQKAKQRMAQSESRRKDDDGEVNWFESQRSKDIRPDNRSNDNGGRGGGKKLAFGTFGKQFMPAPSLANRLGDEPGRKRGDRDRDRDRDRDERDRDRGRGSSRRQSDPYETDRRDRKKRHRDRDRDREVDHRSSERAPRYRGGYSR